MCKYKPQLAKTGTPYIVAFLNGTNCSFVDFTIILECGHNTFILVQLWAIPCQ